MLCATKLHAIGNNVGMCNYNEIGLSLKKISLNMNVLLTDEWINILKGQTETLSVAFTI